MKRIGWACGTLALLIAASSAKAQTTLVPGILKREFWLGATRQQVEAGTLPASTNITYPTSWDVNDGTQNYADRYSGLIIPDTTGDYDFYLAADDDSDLFLSTNDNPTNKTMIAQEAGWSNQRAWTTGGGASTAAQKTSLTWTNGAGAAPFANGIHLIAGNHYYLEGDHHGGGGGNLFGVTMVPHLSGVADGTATTLTNNLIGLVIPTPTTLTFTRNPSNTTAYVSMFAHFWVTTHTDSQLPPTYQWRRNGVDIPGATGPGYSLAVSSSDNGAQFDCIAAVPFAGTPVITVTSTVATLTVPASGGLAVQGQLKRELYLGMSSVAATTMNALTNGNVGVPNSVDAFPSADVPTAGANYGEIMNGYFTPATTGYYVFFIASDDRGLLFVSSDDQPANKRLVAQEDGYSNPRNWLTAGGNGSLSSQKRSDQWSPDGGVTFPYSGGIPMTAGTKYYIEADHQAAGGGNSLTFTVVTTNQVALGSPQDGDASTLTNGVISYVTTPVTSFAITTQPKDTTVFEGFNYTLTVAAQSDGEVKPHYQWLRNGTAVTGANSPNFTAGPASYANDNGAQFACQISIPGVTNATTSTATLTVVKGVFASGQLRSEVWNTDTTVTRALVDANAPGTIPDPDTTTFVNSFNLGNVSPFNNYIRRVSGYFVPPVTTNYVFFFAGDDDSDLFISTDDTPAHKYQIALEAGWSNPLEWVTSGGNSTPVTQKRSDQFTPDGGLTYPGNPNGVGGIPLTAGNRYYIEAVEHQSGGGAQVSATYKYSGEPDPLDGTATRLTGNVIGVLVPAATVINITQEPQSVTTYQWQPAYFTCVATNDSVVPTTYQWRRGGVNIPGATAQSYGFITSASDNGAQFDCIATAPAGGLMATSTVATLTVKAGGTLVPSHLAEERWDGGQYDRLLVEGGGTGYAASNTVVDRIDFGGAGVNYVNRFRGFFIPPVTTNYVFFVASDDDSDVFLSTNSDQPNQKQLICQEAFYSSQDFWITSGSGNATLKRSDTWSPDGGITIPYSGGIWLTNGNRYYLELVHHQGGGGDDVALTYKYYGSPDPVDGDASILTNGVIAYMAAPVVNLPNLTVTRSGNTLNVSWTPAGGTLQSTTDLTNPNSWTDMGTANPASVTIGSGDLYLRVKQ